MHEGVLRRAHEGGLAASVEQEEREGACEYAQQEEEDVWAHMRLHVCGACMRLIRLVEE